MPPGNEEERSATPDDTPSTGDSHSAGKTRIADLEFAVNMLKIRLHSETNLSAKIRLYNQIKTLQDNISTRKSEGSARS